MAIAINQLVPLSFRGRFSRSDYIWSLLALMLLLGILVELIAYLGSWLSGGQLDALSEAIISETHGPEVVQNLWGGESRSLLVSATMGVFVVMIYAYVCATVRRLHDLGYSGVAACFILIPIANMIIPFILMAWPGTVGRNRFGADPRQIVTVDRASYHPHTMDGWAAPHDATYDEGKGQR